MNKAFLKWAGGKSKSLDIIEKSVGHVKGRFIEPFVGSGVVFLNISANKYVLADYNNDLMFVYKYLKSTTEEFIISCEYYFQDKFNKKEKFYELRNEFNNLGDNMKRASLFVYLNRHCFNGLCRYNSKGGFNVPFGKYKKPYFPKNEMLFCSNKLKACDLYYQSFENTIALAKREDVIYCDPPYVPLSDTAHFTAYKGGGFSKEQQEILAALAEKSKCLFMVSNHDTEFTRMLYSKADRIETKQINRFISAKVKGRKKTNELLAIYYGKGF